MRLGEQFFEFFWNKPERGWAVFIENIEKANARIQMGM